MIAINRTAVISLAVVAALASCSSGGENSSAKDDVEEPELATDADVNAGLGTDFAMPLQAYDQADEARRIGTQATDLLIRACVVDEGFDASKVDRFLIESGGEGPRETAAQEQSMLLRGIIGITDERKAAESGYLDAVQARDEVEAILDGQVERGESYTNEYGADFMDALGGHDASGQSGCAGEARAQLRGDIGDPAIDTGELWSDASARSLEDSRIKAVFAAWSDCMAEKRHEYETPIQPLQEFEQQATDLRATGATATPDHAQIATALDDIACKKKANVVGTWFAVWAVYQQQLIEDNAEALQTLLDQQEQRIRLAEDVLAKDGNP